MYDPDNVPFGPDRAILDAFPTPLEGREDAPDLAHQTIPAEGTE